MLDNFTVVFELDVSDEATHLVSLVFSIFIVLRAQNPMLL